MADDKLEYNFKISMPTVLECKWSYFQKYQQNYEKKLIKKRPKEVYICTYNFIIGLHLFGSSSGLLRSTSTSSHSTLFGGGSALTTLIIHYENYGEPLKMFMEEDGVVSKGNKNHAYL